ncbi:NAD(P)/FAD-dependent oxidoreductase [Alteribacter natronophilus]|uniref:NAD(P)/FAD-dependent oxidoreductase n=1 Tax=Alteribacter natronophilus TaxID=2583810 RepID=UPI0014874CF3|nr:FAD-dependent oxidoreductase [Alteribacter natronophilus]
MIYDAVIIGGGLTGVMAARKLKERGISRVLVVDKGKSTGGRMATRRIGSGRADHGAQFFTVRTDRMKSLTEEWLRKGWVSEWFRDPYPRYVAQEGMNRLVRHLAEEVNTELYTKVLEVNQTEGGYTVSGEQDGKAVQFQSRSVIVTAPVPQALDMTAGISLFPEAEDTLKKMHYWPSLVLLVSLDGPSGIGEPGLLKTDLPEEVDTVADNRQKGISQVTIVSIYASGPWSEQHFDLADEDVTERLMKIGRRWFDPESVTGVQLKRWRYAEVKQTHREGFIDGGRSDSLVFAGDAFITEEDKTDRSRVESAVLSGLAAGEYTARRLK